MKKLRQNKGITLIALIITIIVMLILVGVTINVALNGGLFQKAEEAKTKTQKVADEEELQLEILTAYNEKTGEVELSTLKTNLENKGWKDVTISGDKLTCTSPKGNTFTVTADGKIEEGGSISGGGTDPVVAEELKKYILGADGKGRNFEEIIGEDLIFLQDPKDTNSTIHEKIKLAYVEYDEETDEEIWHIRYNRDVYKFKYEEIEDESSEHYEEIWTDVEGFGIVSTPEGNLGKYVEYAGNTWIVLRDSASGVELITANATEEEVTLGVLDFDTAKESYNAAVTTLVNECKNICKEEYGIEIGGNVIGIRSVGGPAVDETTSTQTVDFSKFTEFKPNADFPYAEYNAKNIKIADDKYLEDYNQMKKIGILSADNMYDYLLASRFVYEDSYNVDFKVRCVYNGGVLGDHSLCHVDDRGNSYGGFPLHAVRPVVTLKSGALSGATEEGTMDNPIVLN